MLSYRVNAILSSQKHAHLFLKIRSTTDSARRNTLWVLRETLGEEGWEQVIPEDPPRVVSPPVINSDSETELDSSEELESEEEIAEAPTIDGVSLGIWELTLGVSCVSPRFPR